MLDILEYKNKKGKMIKIENMKGKAQANPVYQV